MKGDAKSRTVVVYDEGQRIEKAAPGLSEDGASAAVIELRTRKFIWRRLVAATRDTETVNLLSQHRRRWATYLVRASE